MREREVISSSRPWRCLFSMISTFYFVVYLLSRKLCASRFRWVGITRAVLLLFDVNIGVNHRRRDNFERTTNNATAMEGVGGCGCKGIRTCLICEEEYSIAKPNVIRDLKVIIRLKIIWQYYLIFHIFLYFTCICAILGFIYSNDCKKIGLVEKDFKQYG